MSNNEGAAQQRNALYRTIWRWHFYAGLFVMPFILILSVTGAIYLFKPQIDRWEERKYHSPRVWPRFLAHSSIAIDCLKPKAMPR
jgi:uncharacterized iron-regulated membrane protein